MGLELERHLGELRVSQKVGVDASSLRFATCCRCTLQQVAQQQPEEKARAKDRRSAKTGVRAGGRAPSSTVEGEGGPDPMTYALQEVRSRETLVVPSLSIAQFDVSR